MLVTQTLGGLMEGSRYVAHSSNLVERFEAAGREVVPIWSLVAPDADSATWPGHRRFYLVDGNTLVADNEWCGTCRYAATTWLHEFFRNDGCGTRLVFDAFVRQPGSWINREALEEELEDTRLRAKMYADRLNDLQKQLQECFPNHP